MENIIEPNASFDFSKLSLATPVGIQGGSYFTKIELNKKPLYIQTQKSTTRQGFVKTGKKYYCDLMFDKSAEILINWFENLEEKCHKLIFEKKDEWFQNNLEENDIENAFNSIIKVYKSGKFYLVRTNVKNTITDLPAIKIYNEQKIPLTIHEITAETNIISILEIQGIKFSSRNFQIDIELKQVMVLDKEPLFDNCLIKTNNENKKETLENITQEQNKEIDIKKENNEELITNQNNNQNNNQINLEIIDKEINNQEDILEPFDILETNKKTQNVDFNFDIEDLDEFHEEDTSTDLKEFNINVPLENNLETISLKKPNQVYFELYKEARNKAKLAKKNAILAYLEAKNIKKTYLIENLNDSDSDFDAEIDEVSESELEGL
jgi:hypothetical protein